MNIFCIGRNYSEHARELNNPVPQTPIVFCKPSGALLRDNKPFYYPDFSEDIQYEVELLLRLAKPARAVPKHKAIEYISHIGLGIDFTARDIQSRCKDKGLPWEIAKGFDHSALIGEWIDIHELDTSNIEFSLKKNKELVQSGQSKDMLFQFEDLIQYITSIFTLQTGDIIFTGTPSGVGPVKRGDLLEGFIGERRMFWTEIR
ncbi:MAG: fumarylacetoacetate hydrolase family protein [Saprospiraceae bacterium]|nr:fumarylacetoacetate hydrolase family protein [Saprospiraceae bacterium]HMW37779.1 fumarylacetoacetate hydrolase family protein [Saprospiraceae bacterium]HMX87465.1 fumarylacetoacetate hydrolase family protein [Saprospiraceae bacterium]HMZ39656.1 fumarylacetoacetate hydrolase family protein [Saprospiraceae bacterium]HNA63560.1 fumarylacetoacetate hydrolase family protein [Saprospiraceae bacterium]